MPVVDASVVFGLIAPAVRDETPVRAVFQEWDDEGVEPVAPGLLWLETESALLTGIRRKRWSGTEADAAAMLLDRIPVRRADSETDRVRAFELARRYDNWPVYDMVYVALAERLSTELVTADKKLRDRLAHLGWVRGPDED